MKPLRCASYNIRIGIETTLAQVAEALIALGPLDVVAFQEISHHWCMGEKLDQTAWLAAALGLPYHCFAGALTHQDGGQFGVALAARWPLRAVHRAPLPRQRDEQRVLLSATMQGPVAVRLFNTHLSVAPQERHAQARSVGAAVAAAPGPTVLFGDLNMGPDDPARRLAQGALRDCFDTCGAGPAPTFSVAEPTQRIDYIAAGGGLTPVAPCWVAREARASDHFPLVATLALHPTKC